MNYLLIRHGKSIVNTAGGHSKVKPIYDLQEDEVVGLSRKGVKQIISLAENVEIRSLINACPKVTVASSTMLRARQSASVFCSVLNTLVPGELSSVVTRSDPQPGWDEFHAPGIHNHAETFDFDYEKYKTDLDYPVASDGYLESSESYKSFRKMVRSSSNLLPYKKSGSLEIIFTHHVRMQAVLARFAEEVWKICEKSKPFQAILITQSDTQFTDEIYRHLCNLHIENAESIYFGFKPLPIKDMRAAADIVLDTIEHCYYKLYGSYLHSDQASILTSALLRVRLRRLS